MCSIVQDLLDVRFLSCSFLIRFVLLNKAIKAISSYRRNLVSCWIPASEEPYKNNSSREKTSQSKRFNGHHDHRSMIMKSNQVWWRVVFWTTREWDLEWCTNESHRRPEKILYKNIDNCKQDAIHGERMSDVTVIEKILRSMTPKFDFAVFSIEGSRDLDSLPIDELYS